MQSMVIMIIFSYNYFVIHLFFKHFDEHGDACVWIGGKEFFLKKMCSLKHVNCDDYFLVTEKFLLNTDEMNEKELSELQNNWCSQVSI